MQHAQGNKKIVLTTGPYIPASQPFPLNEDPEIQPARKILLIIVGVCLGLTVIGAFSSIAGSGAPSNTQHSIRGAQIGQSLISVVFLSFGYLVACRYSQTGLQVFAWLNIVGLVILSIGLIILIFFGFISLTVLTSTSKNQGQGILAGVSIMVIFFVLILRIRAFILQ
ncbi:unnamed protein product, partial [Rotaria magnacalcarata]